MSDRPRGEPGPVALSDYEVDRLAEHLDGLLDQLLGRGDQELAAAIVGLVEGIERLHAEGMRRLVELLARNQTLFDRARRDPVISGLFELYDLSVSDTAEAGGAAAELDPGGVSPTGDTSVVPSERLVQLRRRLDSGGTDQPDASDDVRIGSFDLDALEADVTGVTIGAVSVLLIRHDGGLRAYRNACPGTPLPLHLASLDEGVLTCPWHGCRFDPATGQRLDGDGAPLRPLPVEVEGGQARIAIE